MGIKELQHEDLLRKFKMNKLYWRKAKYNKYFSRLHIGRFNNYEKVKL